MNIDILHLHPEATTPTYATEGAACFDLYACEDATVLPGKREPIRTGIALAPPSGWALEIRSRSGLAFRYGITAFPGVLDSDYRGEILVLLRNDGCEPYRVNAGDRIAQAWPVQAQHVKFWLAEQLDVTERGDSGFGSSGI